MILLRPELKARLLEVISLAFPAFVSQLSLQMQFLENSIYL